MGSCFWHFSSRKQGFGFFFWRVAMDSGGISPLVLDGSEENGYGIYIYVLHPAWGFQNFQPILWDHGEIGSCWFQSFAFQSGIDTPQLTVIFLRWMNSPQPDNPKVVFRLQVFTFRCVWDAHLDWLCDTCWDLLEATTLTNQGNLDPVRTRLGLALNNCSYSVSQVEPHLLLVKS